MKMERFLILDPADSHYLLLDKALRELNYKNIFRAKTGDEALVMVEKEHIQFVITRWELDGMSGTIFIQKLRRKKKGRATAALLYSSRMNDADIELAADCGIENILKIPFDLDSVKTKIASIVDREENLPPREIRLRKVQDYLTGSQPTEAFKLLSPDLFMEWERQAYAYTLSAEVQLGLGKAKEAMSEIDKAMLLNDNDLRTLRVKAKIASRLGDHDTAIATLDALIKRSPKNISNLMGLGQAFVAADRIDEADGVFERLSDIDPDNKELLDGKATVAFAKGNFSLAEELLSETESGLEIVRVFNNMGVSKSNIGQYDEAINFYRHAIKILRDKASMHLLAFNLALAYKKKGDLSNAFTFFVKSYSALPSWNKSYASIVKLHAEAKELGIPLKKEDVQLAHKIRANERINGKVHLDK
ncbi:MAG: tetratricopeptide repeat protein [Proteobacteria bacterium]|nr:MAG: tetratricopeptide repeat protein [Pseudomonadota bacterium]